MINRRELERIQAENGFDMDFLEKVYHMSRILSGLMKIDIVRDNLSLKGGTSLNFLFLDIPRLSTDLDFDFTGCVEKERMERKRPSIESHIESLGKALGYEVRDRGSSYIISRRLFRYEKLSGLTDHVKIEMNYLNRMPLGDIIKMKFPAVIPEYGHFSVNTYTLEELCAQKIAASIDRGLPRDIFDIYQYSRMNMDSDKLKKFAAVYYILVSDSKDIDVEKIARTDPNRIKDELGQFLRDNSNIDMGLIKKSALDFLTSALEFKGSVKEFIDLFYDQGLVKGEIIQMDADLTKHPAIKFIMQKQRSRRGR